MMFYKETNFKETPIGNIPQDWEVAKITKLFDLYKGTTPSTKIRDYWNGNIPFVTPTDITKINDMNEIYLETTENCITEKGLKSKGLKLVPKGSILFTSRATIGYLTINRTEVAINQGIISLIPKQANVDAIFFYYFLQKLKNLFENLAGGSTYKEISMSTLSNVSIVIPPFSEQQKIAELLSTVDEAIRKTNEIIAKTERLKKGLMQELLTKGIGHKEFKDTEIGRIPKDWEVEKLGNKEFAEIIMGQSPPSSTYNREGKGLPFIQGKMEFGDIHPSPILYCSQPIKIAEPNDILISVRAPVGDVNVARYRLCIGRGLAAIRFNLNRASNWFYFYYFQKIKNFLENLGKGSTFKAITKEDLENLKVPYPSFFEQQKIAEILFAIDKKLEIDRNEKAKLERIKQGLMDLLLTGKIRVKVNHIVP
jgi:type I restriction enzyme S subunit